MKKNLSLKTKLVILCLTLATISGVIGCISYFGSSKVTKSYDKVADVALPNLTHLNDMFLAFRDIRINLRSLGLPNLDPAEGEKFLKNITELIASFEKSSEAYRATSSLPGEEELYENLYKEWTSFKALGGKLIAFYRDESPESKEAILSIILKDCPESAAKFTAAIDKLKAFHIERSGEFVTSAKSMAQNTNGIILFFVLSGVFAGITAGIVFSNKITKTVSEIADEMMKSSEKTSLASSDLSESSIKLSDGSSDSAASLEETVSALEELSSMVKLNSDHAKEANALSQKSQVSAQKGEEEITKLITAMNDMSKSSKKIEEIINVIDDIAFQTNLLALNAAVEAARAGEQGKGFAVVADAVRSLAGRSALAAKDINTLIKESVEKTIEGSKIANVSGQALHEIVNSVKKVADLNLEISAASQEQSTGLDQISRAMTHLDATTQSNAATARGVATSATEMSSQSEKLVELSNNLSHFITGRVNQKKEFKRPLQATKKLTIVKKETIPFDEDEAPQLSKAEGF